jgi:tRNA (cytidine/uridine-2'-O-)-methyltransferase
MQDGIMRIALYQPDIPQNTGTILRLCACMGISADLIGPAGFDVSERTFRRAGLDYLEHVDIVRHVSWETYLGERRAQGGRIVLLTTKARSELWRFAFEAADTLLVGRESAGVPDHVHVAADARIRIPMRPGLRSLNVAVATAMALGEAIRQAGAG